VLWFDAHGDLNTPETSPSGDLWGMPLRMLLDAGAVEPEDVILLGARDLDPPEQEYVTLIGLRTDPGELESAIDGAPGVYVALDVDVLEPNGVRAFMPEPGGLTLDETESVLTRIRDRAPVLGAGLSGLAAELSNVEPLVRLLTALGL